AFCSIGWGVFGMFALGSSFAESCFIGFMISFASTAVSIKCLKQAENSSIQQYMKEMNMESIITGILLMQDALFSTAISILPMLATISNEGLFDATLKIIGFVLKAGLSAGATYLFARYVASAFIRLTDADPEVVKLLTAFA